jgi:WD40 repeat protein
LEKKSLTQTGGLFLKVIPKQSEIYINGKLVKKTDFFFGSTLIENLLPKKYKIRVEKSGYFPWEKDLEIKEKEVTEAKNIILFPQNPNFQIILKDIKNLWFSPDGKKIILLEKNEMGWALKLFDLEKNLKSHLIGEKEIYSKGVDLLNLNWSQDSKEIYLDVGAKEQNKNFVLNLEKIPPVLTEKEVTTTAENIVTSQTFNGDNYYLDNFGNLYKNEEKLSEKPFPVKTETEYKLSVFPEKVFLREEKTLYLFNPDSKIFEKFFEGINDLKISPDGKKIVYFSDSEIWVLFLKEKLDPPPKKAGEKILLARFSEKIENVSWLNSDYLIFSTGNKIKITEIDERDKLNIVDLGEFKKPEIFFNQTNKKLYVLSDEILFQSSPLLP